MVGQIHGVISVVKLQLIPPSHFYVYWVSGRRQWQLTPILLPGKSHGRRSLVGCSPWGHKESDTTEQLHFHFSRSCIGEGNGNLLQCPCLENPRDRGAWWAAIYGVAQGWIQLKWLSSSSSNFGLIDKTENKVQQKLEKPYKTSVLKTWI